MPGSPKLILILGVIFSLPKWPIDPSLKLKTRRHHCLMWTACSMVHPPLPLPLVLNLVKFHQSICCWKFFFQKNLSEHAPRKLPLCPTVAAGFCYDAVHQSFHGIFFRTHTFDLWERERRERSLHNEKWYW